VTTSSAAIGVGERAASAPSSSLLRGLGALVGAGALAFAGGIAAGLGRPTWAIFLVNLLFWFGLAATGPAVAAMIEVTEGRWGARLRRIAATTAGFMPVACVLFVVLFTGLAVLYPWVRAPIPKRAAWLNVPFFVGRTLVVVLVLTWASIRYARAVHGSPAGAAEEPGRSERARLAVILLLLYGTIVSLLGYDLIMTLDPTWFSGLLGGYVLVTALYSGFAFLVVLVGFESVGRPAWVMPPKEMQDLAKLVFSTAILWMYFFWSQYLVIWYGNVPVETRYVLARFFQDPYRVLAWTAFFLGWLIPFAYLLGRLTGRPPESHRVLVGVSCLSLTAIFIERIVLVFPSAAIGFGGPGAVVIGVLVTAGFAALFALSFLLIVPRLGLLSRVTD
jgi:Ni/Fe-hydrogenase subunit HybB-like protein